MSLEDNKTVIRRHLEETVPQGNFEVYDTFFAPNLVVHISNSPPHSHASFRKITEQFHQALSDHSLSIQDLIAEGDTVATRFSYAAPQHHGQFGNNPPTGQPLQLELTGFFHFEQGKVTEVWFSYEGASFDLTGFGE